MNAIIQPDHNLSQVAAFFAALTEIDRTAELLRFSYVALKKGETWHLYRGRLDFNPVPRQTEPPRIASDFVRSGTINLRDIGVTPEALLDQLFADALSLPDGDYEFAKGDGSHHTVFDRPDFNGNSLNQTVEHRLQIAGQQDHKVIDYSAVKLDLKGVTDFHGSLDKLLRLYGLRAEGPVQDFGAALVWFVRLPIAELTRHDKKQAGAEIEIRTRSGFAPEQVSLGVSYHYRDEEAPALTLNSGAFRWTSEKSGSRGVMRLVLPEPTKVELVVMHNGKPQHIARPNAESDTFN